MRKVLFYQIQLQESIYNAIQYLISLILLAKKFLIIPILGTLPILDVIPVLDTSTGVSQPPVDDSCEAVLPNAAYSKPITTWTVKSSRCR